MNPSPASERRGILLMLLSILCFAANVLLLRAVSLRAPWVDGYVASVFRGWIGMLVVVVCVAGRGFQPAHLWRQPLLMVRGAVGAAGILLFYLTIEHLGAARAVILNLTYPVFGAVLASMCLREPLSARQFLWMLAALGGLALFFADDAFRGGITRFEWVGLAGAVVAGGAVVLIRLLSHTEHAATIYASQCVWSAFAALPVCATGLARLSAPVVGVLILASVAVAVGQLAMTHSFRSLSVTRGSAIQMVLPIVTALGGMLWFDERLSGLEVAGGLATLAATWQVVRVR